MLLAVAGSRDDDDGGDDGDDGRPRRDDTDDRGPMIIVKINRTAQQLIPTTEQVNITAPSSKRDVEQDTHDNAKTKQDHRKLNTTAPKSKHEHHAKTKQIHAKTKQDHNKETKQDRPEK